MNLPDDETADPFTLAEEERAELEALLAKYRFFDARTPEVVAHVTGLCSAYRAQGYVMGDLAHDGTLKAQAEAGEQ